MAHILSGRVVVVTGAGAGLGRAYARHAAAQGATVVVNDVDVAGAEQTVDLVLGAGGTARISTHPVDDAAAVAELFDHTESDLGPVHGLVNNAGVGYGADPWDEDPARMARLIGVNVLGTLYCGAQALTRMVRRGAGSVVNIGSTVSLGVPSRGTYGASKGAVAALTAGWALDCLDRGPRVNCVAPVAVTGMTPQDTVAPGGAALNDDPNRIAPLVTWLLGDGSGGMTGQVIRFDGRTLRLVAHPRLGEPVVERNFWTVEDIAEAFAVTLADRLEDLGWDRVPSPRPVA